MADSGTDAFALAKIQGYLDIRMTNRCTHASDDARRRAVAKLDTDSDFGNVLVTQNKTGADEFP